MRYELLSFDLDGTLVDTAGELAVAANGALQAHGLAPRPPDEIAHLIGDGSRALMLGLLARVLMERPSLADILRVEAVLETFEHRYARIAGTAARACEGAHDALARLHDAGVRLACVTNKEARHAERVLHGTGLGGFFDLLVGGDTLPQRKPHASVLRHVVAAMRADTQRTAHVGDSHADVEAAHNAGVVAWALPHGYNRGRPIGDARPHRIFAGLREVADHALGAGAGAGAGAGRG